MTSVTIDGNSLASIIAAVGGATAAIITAVSRRTVKATESKVDRVHNEVQTSNGHTLGQLIEQNLPPTLDDSPAPVRVANDHPAGRLQTEGEIVAGQNDSPGQ